MSRELEHLNRLTIAHQFVQAEVQYSALCKIGFGANTLHVHVHVASSWKKYCVTAVVNACWPIRPVLSTID